VYGNEKQPVAGFCIFNDISARDVQAREFVVGPLADHFLNRR
jgi:2-keto-4-pentenoate hydratase/2-oxohepta-3-ene-1,7-dioic acid hydratase in catechol pathway